MLYDDNDTAKDHGENNFLFDEKYGKNDNRDDDEALVDYFFSVQRAVCCVRCAVFSVLLFINYYLLFCAFFCFLSLTHFLLFSFHIIYLSFVLFMCSDNYLCLVFSILFSVVGVPCFLFAVFCSLFSVRSCVSFLFS